MKTFFFFALNSGKVFFVLTKILMGLMVPSEAENRKFINIHRVIINFFSFSFVLWVLNRLYFFLRREISRIKVLHRYIFRSSTFFCT